jgi:hypothetical protein
MTPRAFVLALLFVAACGDKQQTTPPPSSPETKSSTATTAAPSASEAAPPAEPPKPKGKPFEVYSACKDVVTIVIGADPKAPDAGKRTIAPSSSIDVPRDHEGNQTITLMNDKGELMDVKVHVTRGMKRVEVGRSCSTLNAN